MTTHAFKKLIMAITFDDISSHAVRIPCISK